MWNDTDNLDINATYFVKRQTFSKWEIKERYSINYEIVFIISGIGKTILDGKTYDLKEGDFLFLTPEIKNGFYVTKEPYMVFYGVHFTTPNYNRMLDLPFFTHLESVSHFKSLFKSLHGAFLSNDKLSKWSKNLILQEIIFNYCSYLNNNSQPIKYLRFSKIASYINDNLKNNITISDLTHKFGMQKTALIELFKELTGLPPIRYIIDTRLELAKDLISETNLSISDIALQCGFSDPFYFSRCFKNRFSLSPSSYKAKIKNNNI